MSKKHKQHEEQAAEINVANDGKVSISGDVDITAPDIAIAEEAIESAEESSVDMAAGEEVENSLPSDPMNDDFQNEEEIAELAADILSPERLKVEMVETDAEKGIVGVQVVLSVSLYRQLEILVKAAEKEKARGVAADLQTLLNNLGQLKGNLDLFSKKHPDIAVDQIKEILKIF